MVEDARRPVDRLRATGPTQEEVLDVAGIACLFNVMTRLADGLGVDLEQRKAAAVAPWLEQHAGQQWRFLDLAQPIQQPEPAEPAQGLHAGSAA